MFDTAVGRCGLAWTPLGIAAVALPGSSDEAVLRYLRGQLVVGPELSGRTVSGDTVSGHPVTGAGVARVDGVPTAVSAAIERIRGLLAGEPDDLADIQLDTSGLAPFAERVYAVTRAIPPGETLSYGEVAARLDPPGVARAVGQALGHNPMPIVIPCHRVLAADGRLTGFSAPGGIDTKRRLLAIEQAAAGSAPTLFD